MSSPVSKLDLQWAQIVMVKAGATPEAAAQALITDPAVVERLARQIEAEKSAVRAQAEAQVAADYAASPAGRIEAGLAADQARQEKAEKARLSRLLLAEEQGMEFGGDDQAAIYAAGLEQKPGHLLRGEELDQRVTELA